MNPSTRRILWSVFVALVLLMALGVALNLTVMRLEQRQNHRVIRTFEPLLESMMAMDRDISAILAAARAFTLTRRTEFTAQYDESVRTFEKTAAAASKISQTPADQAMVRDLREHFTELKELCDDQITMSERGEEGPAIDKMLEAAKRRRTAHDFAGTFAEGERIRRVAELERLDDLRIALTLALIVISVAILLLGAFAVYKVERSLGASITRQVRRTEAMIAGMADGVMLVDDQGKVVFINPAAKRMLGTSVVGVSIDQQAATYGFHRITGEPMPTTELPAAVALGTGRPAKDVTVVIEGSANRITVLMSAIPLDEEGLISGVTVTFRDVTQRRRLEQEMQLQAERAQILADAGAFFASNVDPVWVTQAIVERVAEVLGDWAAIILKSPESNELSVASIYHRDMTSLGLAWSYIYRQPLLVGQGIIGQVISSGFPSLTSNIQGSAPSETTATYHVVQMKLSSLLVLPLRTRQGIIGALVIAANDPDRQMTDDKLPLAEVLAERAALAIENARLYTEQVEARRKVEDLSRLKDEFLSIASHELRTPVTSIKGYTQLAKTLIHENDLATSEEYLNVALDQIDRMSRLILELLDVSRIETGRLEIRREPIPWIEFVRDAVSHQNAAFRDRQFKLEVTDSEKMVLGDRDRLEQVLGNLLENAVKYSSEGSEISVTVTGESDRFITSVRDRGIGIPADELGQVFERFHRGRQVSSTNYGGLGLGLYITQQIVERHGGMISVESREGEGTTFQFSLPAHASSGSGEVGRG